MTKDRVLYCGRQWRVTSGYLETLDDGRTYYVAKHRLLETRPFSDPPLYDLPMHMTEKDPWIDYEDFLAAFVRALEIHHPHHDKAMLARTLKHARQAWAEVERAYKSAKYGELKPQEMKSSNPRIRLTNIG
jgi:hypothetical protein